MSQQEDTEDFYAAGRKLAQHIADSNDKDISTATLQALIRDFLPQHEDTHEALRGIVSRPDFLQLVKLSGGGAKGILQRDAFLERLKNVYSPKIISNIKHLASGLLQVGTGNGIGFDKNKQTIAGSLQEMRAEAGCHANEKPEYENDTSLNQRQSRTIAIVALMGAFCMSAIYLGSLPNSIPKTQSRLADSGEGCTATLQAEMNDLAGDLKSKIKLVDERRMTGGTWQSILTAYNQNRATLPQSQLVEDYILIAKRAKELEAVGCFFSPY
jgi:hypothetical protein